MEILGASCDHEYDAAFGSKGSGMSPRTSRPDLRALTEGFDALDLKEAKAVLDEFCRCRSRAFVLSTNLTSRAGLLMSVHQVRAESAGRRSIPGHVSILCLQAAIDSEDDNV
jgi:hypothetical protein